MSGTSEPKGEVVSFFVAITTTCLAILVAIAAFYAFFRQSALAAQPAPQVGPLVDGQNADAEAVALVAPAVRAGAVHRLGPAELRQRRLAALDDARAQEERRREGLRQQQEEAEKEELLQRQLEAEKEEEEARKTYELWSSQMKVEEMGVETLESNDFNLGAFLDAIKAKKVVVVEVLAAEFNMRTADAARCIHDLTQQGMLTGVTDDRGKFTYVSDENIQAIRQLLFAKGRMSMHAFADECARILSG